MLLFARLELFFSWYGSRNNGAYKSIIESKLTLFVWKSNITFRLCFYFHVNLMLFNGVVATIWQKLMNLVIDVQRKKMHIEHNF